METFFCPRSCMKRLKRLVIKVESFFAQLLGMDAELASDFPSRRSPSDTSRRSPFQVDAPPRHSKLWFHICRHVAKQWVA